MNYYETTIGKHVIARVSLRINGTKLGGGYDLEETVKVVSNSVPREGSTSQRPNASDIYVGFEFFDTTLNKWMYARRFVNNGVSTVVDWAERVALPNNAINYLTKQDEGFEYFDTTLGKPIYAKQINITTGVITWVDATGATV